MANINDCKNKPEHKDGDLWKRRGHLSTKEGKSEWGERDDYFEVTQTTQQRKTKKKKKSPQKKK